MKFTWRNTVNCPWYLFLLLQVLLLLLLDFLFGVLLPIENIVPPVPVLLLLLLLVLLLLLLLLPLLANVKMRRPHLPTPSSHPAITRASSGLEKRD